MRTHFFGTPGLPRSVYPDTDTTGIRTVSEPHEKVHGIAYLTHSTEVFLDETTTRTQMLMFCVLEITIIQVSDHNVPHFLPS